MTSVFTMPIGAERDTRPASSLYGTSDVNEKRYVWPLSMTAILSNVDVFYDATVTRAEAKNEKSANLLTVSVHSRCEDVCPV